jgi:hypothetical protein
VVSARITEYFGDEYHIESIFQLNVCMMLCRVDCIMILKAFHFMTVSGSIMSGTDMAFVGIRQATFMKELGTIINVTVLALCSGLTNNNRTLATGKTDTR